MKELLLDGLNYVNEDGDVVPIDHPEWDKIDTDQEPDHYFAHSPEDSVETPFTPEVSLADKTPERGASVSLGQRAIAIEAIMGYFNQANKRNGLSKSRGYNGFDPRYGRRAGEVVSNMSKKEERLYREFTHAVDSLMQRDALVAQGFDEESVDGTAAAVKRDLYRNYGPGNADYSDRAKLTRKVKTTARRAGGSKR